MTETPFNGSKAHITGDVNYRRRMLLQLSSTMAFVLNKLKLTGTGYQPKEENAIHEVISWGRMTGNNKTVEKHKPSLFFP